LPWKPTNIMKPSPFTSLTYCRTWWHYLGYIWLRKHNPHVNWHQPKVMFHDCPPLVLSLSITSGSVLMLPKLTSRLANNMPPESTSQKEQKTTNVFPLSGLMTPLLLFIAFIKVPQFLVPLPSDEVLCLPFPQWLQCLSSPHHTIYWVGRCGTCKERHQNFRTKWSLSNILNTERSSKNLRHMNSLHFANGSCHRSQTRSHPWKQLQDLSP